MSGGEEKSFVELDGTKLYFETKGTGDPLVLVHPEDADCRIWEDQFAALSEHFRVIRYDRRYWGKSKVYKEDFWPEEVEDFESYSAWTEDQPSYPAPYKDLHGLLDDLGVERAHLVGLWDGGNVVLDFAVEHPERVLSLTLLDTVVTSAASFETMHNIAEEGLRKAAQDHEELDSNLRDRDLLGMVEREFDSEMEDGDFAATTEATKERLRQMYRENAAAIVFVPEYEELDPPAGERLHEIEAPTLIVLTGERHPDAREFDESLVAGIQNATVRRVPDASPTFNMDRPEEFNRMLLDFLTSV